MPQPLTFEEFETTPTAKERKSAAETAVAEATAPNAPRLSAAETEKAEAEARKAAADADIAEKKAAAAAEAAADLEAGKGAAKTQTALDMQNYLGQIQAVRDAISTGRATGPFAQLTGGVFGSDAADMQAQLEALKSPIVLKALQDARKGSAAGATGFGALVNRELNLLASKLGTLDAKAKPETLLRTLNAIEQQYRRAIAAVAGYDPDSAEGAVLAGLEPPAGAEPPIPEGEIGEGEWSSNPELRGVDAAVTSMIKAGRSAPQIRAWLNQYQEGLGDRTKNIEQNIQYYKQTGKDPGVMIERVFTPSEPTLISQLADNPFGAGVLAAGDQALSGFTSELASGELEGSEYEKAAAVQRGMREKYPTASAIGDVVGGVGTALVGAYGAAKAGLRLPSFFEGVGQEALYGFGSGEPGDRGANALYSATTAPVANIVGKPIADIAGNVLRGADPERAMLAERYGVNLTPGQLTGREATERTVAGLPIAGPQVAARRNETLEQFNKATFDEALAPLGATTGGVGQRGVAEAQQIVSDAYEQALGGRTFQLDAPFVQTVRGRPYAILNRTKGTLGPKAAREVDRIVDEMNQNGVVDGRAWQQARRQLVDLQSNPEIKNDISGNAVRGSIDEIIDGFDDLVARQAPDALDTYTSANAAYRNLKIVERAVEYAPDGTLFGPNNLRSATRISTQKFGGKSASARGDRPFNDLTMAALDVIPNKADDVSLTGRVLAPAAGAGGFGAIAATSAFASPEQTDKDEDPGFVPPWMLAAGLGAGLASLPYSRRGNRLITAPMLGPRSDRQRMLGDLIQNYAPAAFRGVVLRKDSEMGAPMPAEFDYGELTSPELRSLMDQAAANTDAMAPLEGPVGGFEADQGGAPVMIGGRAVVFDETTGKYYDAETGDEMVGYKRGGPVSGSSWQERQRAQQERIASGRRAQERQMEAARQATLTANQARVRRAQREGRGRTTSEGRGYNTNAARLRTALQGLTYASGDEIEAGLREGFDALTDLRAPSLAEYYNIKDDINRGLDRYSSDNPGEALLLEGGGAALTGFIPGMQGASGARLAALAARYPTRAALAGLGAESAAYGVGVADRPEDIPRSVVEEGIPALLLYGGMRGGGAGVRKGAELLNRAPDRGNPPSAGNPTIENIIAYPSFTPEGAPVSILSGRPMRSAEDALYAQRRMSRAELEDALASGEFRLPPTGRTQHGEGKKWWSPSDDEGVFGRQWLKGGEGAVTVRVPLENFDPKNPVQARFAARWDDQAGTWVPVVPEYKVGGRVRRRKLGGLAVKRNSLRVR